MPRLYHIPLGLLLACLLAGGYGALHDQVSYTISPEYFTVTKFAQFTIPEHLHNRLGVALVGWLATWWMGLLAGIFLVPAALVCSGRRGPWRQVVAALLVALATAAVVSALTLPMVLVMTGIPSPIEPFIPPGVDKMAYARVALLHNASYAGGMLGIAMAVAYVIITHLRVRGPGKESS